MEVTKRNNQVTAVLDKLTGVLVTENVEVISTQNGNINYIANVANEGYKLITLGDITYRPIADGQIISIRADVIKNYQIYTVAQWNIPSGTLCLSDCISVNSLINLYNRFNTHRTEDYFVEMGYNGTILRFENVKQALSFIVVNKLDVNNLIITLYSIRTNAVLVNYVAEKQLFLSQLYFNDDIMQLYYLYTKKWGRP